MVNFEALSEDLKAVLKKANQDEDFKSKLNACSTKEELLVVFQNHGFEISLADLDQIVNMNSDLELSEDDLETISGGFCPFNFVEIARRNGDI